MEEAASGSYIEIVYGPHGDKLALINGLTQAVNAAFLPLPGGATAVYDATGLKRYRHADWLGSSRLSSTPSRAIYYDGAYSPMGESYVETGSTDRNFTGQNQELANDLYAFPYREYHPIHGRWISPDPAGLAAVNPANPQSWNRYAYVNGSPMNSVDPLGLTPMCVKQGACVGESIVHAYGGAGIYGSLTFAGTTLGTMLSPTVPAGAKTDDLYFCDECNFKVWGYDDMPKDDSPAIPAPDFYSFAFELGPLAYSYSAVPSTKSGVYSMGGGTGTSVSLTAGWMVRGEPNGLLTGPSFDLCYFYGGGGCYAQSLTGEAAVQIGLGLGGRGAAGGSGIDPVQILKDMLFSHPVDGPLATKTGGLYMDDETPSWLRMVP